MTAPQLLEPIAEMDGLAAVHNALILARLDKFIWRAPVIEDGAVVVKLSVINRDGWTLPAAYLDRYVSQLAALLPGWSITVTPRAWLSRALWKFEFRRME